MFLPSYCKKLASFRENLKPRVQYIPFKLVSIYDPQSTPESMISVGI